MSNHLPKWTVFGVLAILQWTSMAFADPPEIPLPEALDAPGLVWTTSGSSPWLGQNGITHDGLDAAGSGTVPDAGSAYVQTTVTGPGLLSFWWKVSSELNNDRLALFLNGVEQSRISGEVNWVQQNVSIPAGLQTLKWTYSKNASLTAGQDRAWVDQVQFNPFAVCTYTISPVNGTHPSGSATGLVSVATSAECAWIVSTTNAWVTVASGTNGTGTGLVRYILAPNPGDAARTGWLLIGGQSYTITQAGVANTPCTYSISPSSRTHGYGAATNVVNLTTSSGCAWEVSNTNAWLTVISGGNGSGSASVAYAVAANPGTDARSGTVLIAGRAFNLTQAGRPNGTNAPCTFAILPTSAVHSAGTSTGLVTVVGAEGCAWQAFNTNGWVTLLSATNGSGSAAVVYALAANPGTATRTGTILMAGNAFSVTQLGNGNGTNTPCTFTISPASATHSAEASSFSAVVNVAAVEGCAWNLINTNAWIAVVSGTNGDGSGTVRYKVVANLGSAARTGFLRIAGQLFSITQSGGGVIAPSPDAVEIPPVTVTELGHRFFNGNIMAPLIMPSVVADCLIDQDRGSGGGEPLPNVSVNWDTNTQFSVTVAAPAGFKFLVRVPPGRAAGFGGFLWWESTRGGFSGPGSVTVRFTGLEGTAPNFSGASPVLSDSHGFFGFGDLEGGTFSGELAFTSIKLTATVLPQFTGNGVESYVPHGESRLEIFYNTPETADPGRFVSIVPVDSVPKIQVADISPEGALLMVRGAAGRINIVQYSDDLVNWHPISTNLMPATVCPTCPYVHVHDNSVTPRRFYRAVEVP